MRDAIPLTDLKVSKAKPRPPKSYRLHDGAGLALLVAAGGSKSWQYRYRLADGREQTWTIGKLTNEQGLAWARKQAREARERVERGEHLTVVKRQAKAKTKADAANTFKAVSDAWVADENREQGWTADYLGEVKASIRNHLSALDDEPMTKIDLPRLAPLLSTVKRKSPDMHAKVRSRLNAILWYAVEQGFVTANPLPPVHRRKGRAARVRHYPAIISREGVGEILRQARSAHVGRGVQRAHLLLAFTAQRVGEIVPAQWSEIDLMAGTWSVPRERMKRKDPDRGPHQVPIPPMLLGMMHEWREADGKDAIYVCPSPRGDNAHVTRESLEKFYRRTLSLAKRHGPHSWRSVFSSWARDAGKNGDTIEAQLDHVVGNKVAAAYDRAKRLELRRELITWYESTLVAARDGASIVKLKGHHG